MANEIMTLAPNQVVLPSSNTVGELLAELSDIGEDLELGRVKLAASSMPIFEIIEMGADESVMANTIDAVVLFAQKQNVRWPDGASVGGQLPVCRSNDGIRGYDQNGMMFECATCPMNQFGSAPGGGKVCKNTVVLYLIRPADGERQADMLPLKLQLPATSIQAWNRYRTALAMRGLKMAGVVTQLSVRKAKNKDGVAYGEAVFKLQGKLTPDLAHDMTTYADAFKLQVMPKPDVLSGFTEVDADDSPF